MNSTPLPSEINNSVLIEAVQKLKGEGKIKRDAEIAQKLELSKAVVSEYLNNKKAVSQSFLTKFASAFHLPMLSVADQSVIENIKTSEGSYNGIITHNPLLKAPKKGSKVDIDVPYYDADFVAGNGISFFEDNVDRPSYTMSIPGYAGCIAFPCYGDSMENLIRGGSVLFGRKIEDWRSYLEYGQIYGVVMKDERRFLKYVRKAEDAKNCFLLRSENEKYDDFEVPKNKIHNIWLIEGWMLKRA